MWGPHKPKTGCFPGTCVCLCVLSLSSRVQLFVTPWTAAHQAPLSMGFSRQEYWSGLPSPPPQDLPDPEVELVSLMSPALAGRFFTTNATWEALELGCLQFLSRLCFIHFPSSPQTHCVTALQGLQSTRLLVSALPSHTRAVGAPQPLARAFSHQNRERGLAFL